MPLRGFLQRRILSWASALSVLVIALASTLHPASDTGATAQSGNIPEQLGMDMRTAAVFWRSCADCHSSNTRWPWYSKLPSASWLIERDVKEARKHFNASRWATYSVAQKREILADVARVISNGEMPVPQYLLLHRSARLSDRNGQALLSWAREQRRSLGKAKLRDKPSLVPTGVEWRFLCCE